MPLKMSHAMFEFQNLKKKFFFHSNLFLNVILRKYNVLYDYVTFILKINVKQKVYSHYSIKLKTDLLNT